MSQQACNYNTRKQSSLSHANGCKLVTLALSWLLLNGARHELFTFIDGRVERVVFDRLVCGAKTLIFPPFEAAANALPVALGMFVFGAITCVSIGHCFSNVWTQKV